MIILARPDYSGAAQLILDYIKTNPMRDENTSKALEDIVAGNASADPVFMALFSAIKSVFNDGLSKPIRAFDIALTPREQILKNQANLEWLKSSQKKIEVINDPAKLMAAASAQKLTIKELKARIEGELFNSRHVLNKIDSLQLKDFPSSVRSYYINENLISKKVKGQNKTLTDLEQACKIALLHKYRKDPEFNLGKPVESLTLSEVKLALSSFKGQSIFLPQ